VPMAADDPRRLLRVPGRLAFGCDDLTAAWPHGGTGIGSAIGVQLQSQGGSFPITSEAMGGEPVEFIERGQIWGLACTLRSWVDDVLDLIFPNTSAGTTTQRQVIADPGTVRAGNWMSGRGVVLVFTPEGATHAKSATAPDVDAPFAVLYRAIPLIQESAELRLEQDAFLGVPALFAGIRDGSGRTIKIGPRKDIAL